MQEVVQGILVGSHKRDTKRVSRQPMISLSSINYDSVDRSGKEQSVNWYTEFSGSSVKDDSLLNAHMADDMF